MLFSYLKVPVEFARWYSTVSPHEFAVSLLCLLSLYVCMACVLGHFSSGAKLIFSTSFQCYEMSPKEHVMISPQLIELIIYLIIDLLILFFFWVQLINTVHFQFTGKYSYSFMVGGSSQESDYILTPQFTEA